MAAALIPGIAPLWTLSVAQYHEMIAKGILSPDDPVELLDGIIVQKMPKNPPHRIATLATAEALRRAIPPGWYVDSQEPVTIGDSEPEPDVAVIRGTTRDYTDRHPGARDIGLVVEIAEATLDRDRVWKQRIYANAGVPVYWVMDLRSRRIESFAEPAEGAYSRHTIYEEADNIELVLDGVAVGVIALSDLLP